MRKAVLWILGGAAGLTALILIAAAIAVATVDVKTLVAPIQARIKTDTGRDLAIAGPIDLKMSLEPKLVAEDVTLGNAPWAGAKPMMRAKRVEVQVKLLPLLEKRFEVVEVALVEPTIALETNASGQANWDFAAASTPVAAAAAAPAPASVAGAVAIGNLVVRDGTLTYRDGASGKATSVVIERLALRSRKTDAPIDAEFKGKVDDVAVSLSGNLGPLDALRGRNWPYPVALKGDIAGKPANLTAKIAVQGETTTLDGFDVAWGPLALKGDVKLVRAGNRTRYVFTLAAPSLSPRDLAVAGAAATGVTSVDKGGGTSRTVIPDQPLPLAALKNTDLEGTLTIGELVIDARNTLRNVTVKLTNVQGKLDLSKFEASGYGGTINGQLSIDATNGAAPPVRLRIDGRNLDLGALLAAIGEQRQVNGGKTTVTLDIGARGTSLHGWAATATGQALVSIGPATLVNTKLDLDDVFDKLSGAVNPYRAKDPSTELTCGVIRLPLTDGIARVDRSIAMETRKIGVSASGTVNFRDETLDLALRPRIRDGIPLDIPSFADLVHFSGPLAHPSVKIDAVRSAATVAKIGAAISTGGLSMLGSTLLEKAADEGAPCDVALGRASPTPKAPAEGARKPAADPSAVGNEVGKALGRIFGR